MKLPRGCSLFYRDSKKRWVLSYADPTRGQPQKVLPREIQRERDAQAWALTWLEASHLDPSAALVQRRDEGPSVGACAERWLRLREADPRVAPATLKGNRGHLTHHVLPTFAETPIAALAVPELRAWLRGLRQTMGPKGARTVRNVFYTLATLFADAMAEGWVKGEANVLDHPGVKRELPVAEDTRPMRLPVLSAQTLIEAAAVPLERRARYVLAFTTGMRDGEIAGATLAHLHLDAPIPHLEIVQAVAIVGAKGKGGWAKPKAPKTKGSKRTLPLHPAAVAALREWMAEGWPALVGRAPGPADYLFPGEKGGPCRPKSAAQLRADLAAVGLPVEIDGAPVEFKATRSSFATWLDERDVPQPKIKRLMGHTALDVTQRHYTARDLEQLAAAVLVIPLVWTPGTGTRPPAVTAGTTEALIPLDFLAPPARIGRATFGLGKRARDPRGSAGNEGEATSRLTGDASANVFHGANGPRNLGRRGAGTRPRHTRGTGGESPGAVSPELARLGEGLARLRGMEDALDAFLLAGEADELDEGAAACPDASSGHPGAGTG